MVSLDRRDIMATTFEEDMQELRESFMDMGLLVSEQILKGTQAFFSRDLDLAQHVVDDDEKVNNAEIDLEKQALYMMVLQQPLASNFRNVVSVLKASYDLERIGDQAALISRETISLEGIHRSHTVEQLLQEQTKTVRRQLEEMLQAYYQRDSQYAQKISDDDDIIDKTYVHIRNEITKWDEKGNSKAAVSYIMVNRALERIGDHIVNLAEWIIYSNSGKITELNGKTEDRHIWNDLNVGSKEEKEKDTEEKSEDK